MQSAKKFAIKTALYLVVATALVLVLSSDWFVRIAYNTLSTAQNNVFLLLMDHVELIAVILVAIFFWRMFTRKKGK